MIKNEYLLRGSFLSSSFLSSSFLSSSFLSSSFLSSSFLSSSFLSSCLEHLGTQTLRAPLGTQTLWEFCDGTQT